MKIKVKNFSGTLSNGTDYRISWKIDQYSITLNLSTYNSGLDSFLYEDIKSKLYDKENFLQKRNELLNEASNDWSIDLIENKNELLKTA